MGAKRLPPLSIPDDPATLGYVAGVVDGEGCIGISSAFQRGVSRSRSHSLRVTITNTNPALMAWLSATFGGGLTIGNRKAGKNWKTRLSWSVYAHQAEQLLVAIEPYLVIKKAQARVALEFRSIGRGRWVGRALAPEVVERREQLKGELHVLNRRGIA